MAYPSELRTGGIIFNNTAISGAVTVNSDVLNIERAKHIGLDLFLDNTDMVGNVQVEVCNDLTVAVPNWVPIELSTGSTLVPYTSGTDLNDFYDLTDVAAKYLQVSIVNGSGGGTVRVVAHCKAV